VAKVFIIDQPELLFEQCAQRILQLASEVLATQERFHIALAGGNTPRELYRHLRNTPASSTLDWKRIEFYFGDERCAPPDHPDSNYRMAKETLLAPLGIAEESIHRIRAELPPHEAVEQYLVRLQNVPQENRLPRFDLVLLGVGADGHIASLFPGSALLDEKEAAFGASYIDKLESWRFSLTLPAINNARHIILMASGSKKADIIRHVLHCGSGAMPLPVELLERKNLEWFLDQEASHFLDEEYDPCPPA
jgi:6-phosphogluconolactonase